MTKNVTVLSSEGNLIGATYPKRAMGLVKKGRARYLDGDETVIVLAASPDDITSQEDEMNNNFNFDEFIEKTKAAAKAAGETVYHATETAADKAEDALNRALAHLNSTITDYLAKNDAEAASVEDEIAELENDLGEVEAELAELESDLDEISEVEGTEDSDTSIKLREKVKEITAKISEKVQVREALRISKEICKNALNSTSEAIKDTAKRASEAVKEVRHSVNIPHENCDLEANRDRMIEEILDRIHELRAMRTETEAYLDTIAEMQVGGPGDIATQAKANAITEIACTHAEQNRNVLKVYTSMLDQYEKEKAQAKEYVRMHESAENKAKESRRRMFTSTVEMITRADESTDVNVLAFYIRTAEKLAKEDGIVSPELAESLMKEMLTETDVNKLSCYMNIIDNMK